MTNDFIPSSELILNNNGSIYHLGVKPEDVSTTIITVGDQDRVEEVTKHFEKITFSHQTREFKTVTGLFKGRRLTVLSTGIGTDNIDIAVNELDALFQIDFKTRKRNENHTQLNIIRVGTSGSIQENIPIDCLIAGEIAVGFDNLLHFYNDNYFETPENWPARLSNIAPLITHADSRYVESLPSDFTKGVTATMPGFYAPQGRQFRLPSIISSNLSELRELHIHGKAITNIEMESSAIYGLSTLLGHRAIALNTILANRITGEFSSNYHQSVDRLIEVSLDWIVKNCFD